jgi:bacterial/archaeal transporter family protein
MTAVTGVFLALVALFSWGVADFLIQRSARYVGIIKTTLLIGLVSLVAFTPFVLDDLATITSSQLLLLFLTGCVLTVGSLLDFAALREGKMAVAEPIIGLETPLTVLFAVVIAHEDLSLFQIAVIGMIFIGTILIVTKQFSHLHYHKRLFEKGVKLAALAAIGLAAANFLVGESSQQLSPFLAIWSVGFIHVLVCAVVLLIQGKLHTVAKDVKRHPWTLIGQAIVDNVAWISFAAAALFIPISITASISSGYIAVAVLLGIFISREKVRKHQLFGVVLVSVGIAVLSYFYG